MRAKWLVIAASVVLLGLAAAGVAILRRESLAKAARRESVSSSAPAPADLVLPVAIRARHILPVAAPAEGTIAEFFADAGQDVYEGQLLAHISDQELETTRDAAKAARDDAEDRAGKLQSALLNARLEASRARADAERARAERESTGRSFERQRMLYGQGATPRLTYERSEREAASAAAEFQSLDVLARQAQDRVDQANAELESARRLATDKAQELEAADGRLKGGDVYSPADGMVVARRGEVGKPVPEEGASELFDIAVNLVELEAVLDAEPSALARLSPGQGAMLFFADVPGEGIPGAVREIKGGQAIVDFVSPNPVIRPGMTAQIRITLR